MKPRAGVRLLLATLLAAAPVVTPAGAAAAPALPAVVEATLDNGLRVLLLEDRRSPIVSIQTWFRVGSRNERRGATGLAHFLEHLMFKGTARHGPREFARLVEQNGGQDNAFTSQDVTGYYVDIAADRLGLVLELEADRMRNLLLDPREIDSERQVVLEERRTRTEDDPAGFLAEEVGALAFRAHPYGQPIVGWSGDIARVTPGEIRAFYQTYYVPGNAVVVVVGDFDAAAVLARIRAAFGAIPRGPAPPAVTAVEPPQRGERRVTVRRPAQLPLVSVAYHVPNQRAEDAAALEVLATVLASGRASRLDRVLVQDRQVALEAGAEYSYLSLDPGLFWLWATALPGQSPEALEGALLGELERLAREPVNEEELARARNQLEAAFVFADDSVHRRASLLARFELAGGWALRTRYLERVRAVTAADIQRAARTYFAAESRTVGILLPRP